MLSEEDIQFRRQCYLSNSFDHRGAEHSFRVMYPILLMLPSDSGAPKLSRPGSCRVELVPFAQERAGLGTPRGRYRQIGRIGVGHLTYPNEALAYTFGTENGPHVLAPISS